MPIYEYECSDCGHAFEKFQQMSDPDPDECPECRGREVRRLVSESSFKLKGDGWFEDGYSSAPDETSSETDDTSSSDGEDSAASSDDGTDADAAAE